MSQTRPPIRVTKAADIERERDRVRSIEIAMTKELIRRYPKHAREALESLREKTLTTTSS